ncbi:non-specific lipid transfer protein GPI-anchored 3-like [Euphorbia lathyris]|uniref:non-specific lipid transfer protein GPI-anchored 3-like n=1 Tax=Euphorbia lathyris TaxID=212925 RepID=UPI0033130C16
MNFNFIISITLVLFSISSISLPLSSSQDVDALTQQYGGLISQSLGAVTDAAKKSGDGGSGGLQNLIQTAASGKAKCVKQLLPCQQYFKSSKTNTDVPESCCEPLKAVVEDDIDCLCGVVKSAELLKTINVTLDDAFNVAKTCGSDPDISVCDDNSPSPAPGPAMELDPLTEPKSTGPALDSPALESPALASPVTANSPAPSAATTAADESGGLRMYSMEKSNIIVFVLTFMLIAFF